MRDQAARPANWQVPRETPRWYEWVIAIVLMLAVLGHFVVKPAVEALLQGAGRVVGSVAHGLSVFLQAQYAVARFSIEHDPQVVALLGPSVACPLVDQVQWLDSQGRQELAFTFPVAGSRRSGQAHVIVGNVGGEYRPVSIIVEVADQCVLVPPLP